MSDQLTTVCVCEQLLGVQMRRKGRVYQGCCPCHHERTPSFTVFPDGACRCYGCGAYFSNPHFLVLAVRFGVQERYSANQHHEVADALVRLGVNVRRATPARPSYQVQTPSRAEREALKPVLAWCQQELVHGPDPMAREYIFQRGLAPEALPYFGYCPARAPRQLLLQSLCDPALLYATGFINTQGGFIHSGRLLLMEMDTDIRFYQSRALEYYQTPKYRHARHWTPPVTLLEGHSEEIHVVEGLIDGLTLRALGMTTLVTWSATHTAQVEMPLRRFVAEQRPIVLWQDPGEAGRQFVSRLVPLVADGPMRLMTPEQDPNAWWLRDPAGLQHALHERTSYAIA